MAMIYKPRELAVEGKGIGRFRMVGMSDEEEGALHELCRCPNGHETPEGAESCREAATALKRLFPGSADGPGEIPDVLVKGCTVDGKPIPDVPARAPDHESPADIPGSSLGSLLDMARDMIVMLTSEGPKPEADEVEALLEIIPTRAERQAARESSAGEPEVPTICTRCHEPLLEGQEMETVSFHPRLGLSGVAHVGCEWKPTSIEFIECEVDGSSRTEAPRPAAGDGEGLGPLVRLRFAITGLIALCQEHIDFTPGPEEGRMGEGCVMVAKQALPFLREASKFVDAAESQATDIEARSADWRQQAHNLSATNRELQARLAGVEIDRDMALVLVDQERTAHGMTEQERDSWKGKFQTLEAHQADLLDMAASSEKDRQAFDAAMELLTGLRYASWTAGQQNARGYGFVTTPATLERVREVQAQIRTLKSAGANLFESKIEALTEKVETLRASVQRQARLKQQAESRAKGAKRSLRNARRVQEQLLDGLESWKERAKKAEAARVAGGEFLEAEAVHWATEAANTASHSADLHTLIQEAWKTLVGIRTILRVDFGPFLNPVIDETIEKLASAAAGVPFPVRVDAQDSEEAPPLEATSGEVPPSGGTRNRAHRLGPQDISNLAEGLARVTPEQVCRYLEENGWRKKATECFRYEIGWDDDSDELIEAVVPARGSVLDWALRIDVVLHNVAIVENCAKIDILRSMLGYDVGATNG